jgi:tagatose-1,6-bisphosphate aldolase non-catalytic subunit AgaZ/GatZ
MLDIDQIIKAIITRNVCGQMPVTLLAVCPNSTAVLQAAIRAAARNQTPMLFAATLNQVDYEASYTGWTPADFVRQMHVYADQYHWNGPLYPCLDHGGPWLKDLHTMAKLSYVETMQKVKNSITACVEAGYRLLHIDPTIDRSYVAGEALPLELVVERTVELMAHAEYIRVTNGGPKIAYEVGTEEVHGGLVDLERFEGYINLLRAELHKHKLAHCWPCLFVAQIGTNLHTTMFKPEVAKRLYSILAPFGSLAKGHYTDWVENPEDYPACGMGAANVGPEFTAVEYTALADLEDRERVILTESTVHPSNFMPTLQRVVVESGRWKKWLLSGEESLPFEELSPARKDWLLKTGSRYIWMNEEVTAARTGLYRNLRDRKIDPDNYVVEKITLAIEKYIKAFNLQNALTTLGE